MRKRGCVFCKYLTIWCASFYSIYHKSPDEWALNICMALGNVDEYWNPPGGKSFFNKSKYDSSGIELCFHEITLKPYDQKRPAFEPGLSILDVMMFNSIAEINDMLNKYTLT